MTYVLDICEAFYKVMKCQKLFGQVVNAGSDNNISIKNIVNKISQIIGKKLIIKNSKKRIRPLKSEVFRLRCNNHKIIKYTNWKPKNTFDQGLKKTVDWNIEFLSKNMKIKDYII